MATRFYFQSTGATAINPGFDGGWEQTGSAARLPLVRKTTRSVVTAIGNTGAITIPITTTQQILALQFVSDEIFRPVDLYALTNISFVIRCSENATSNNAFLAYVARAFDAVANVSLGTLSSSMTNTGTEFPLTASSATRIFNTSITPLVIRVPWRLVWEIGAHAQAPSAAGSYIIRVGANNASDFALSNGLTTDLNPWGELSTNLEAMSFNNYLFPTAGSGMSYPSERTR